MLDRVSYERGLRLRGVPLFFDAPTRRQLCVVTSFLARLPPRHDRLVVSPGNAHLLARLGYGSRVLPTALDHWVTVAGQRFRLTALDDEGFQTAAEVVSGKERLVVAGLLPERAALLPPADLLVATTPALEQKGAKPESVERAVAMFARQGLHDRLSTWILVDCVAVGRWVVARLREQELPVRPVGELARLLGWQERKRQPIKIAFRFDPKAEGAARLALVDSGLGMGASLGMSGGPDVDATFRLRWHASWAALKRALKETKASHLALLGPRVDSEALGERLGTKVQVRHLGPVQQLRLDAGESAAGSLARFLPSGRK